MTWFGNALLAALCWGSAPFFEKAGLQATADPTVGVIARSAGVLAGTLVLVPFFPRLGPQLSAIPWRNLVFIGIGGVLASVVGQAFFYRALKAGEVSRAVSVGASYPVIAFLLGFIIMKEPLTASKSLGVLSVVLGIWLLR
jgi:DME family drug/metabolite transporter